MMGVIRKYQRYREVLGPAAFAGLGKFTFHAAVHVAAVLIYGRLFGIAVAHLLAALVAVMEGRVEHLSDFAVLLVVDAVVGLAGYVALTRWDFARASDLRYHIYRAELLYVLSVMKYYAVVAGIMGVCLSDSPIYKRKARKMKFMLEYLDKRDKQIFTTEQYTTKLTAIMSVLSDLTTKLERPGVGALVEDFDKLSNKRI